ncbi:hypothetical protein Tco_1113608 [Tanacetum coccineum]|uniref:Uncharacterized protein n=1 Tax=Tanacetum coccineum TaxID=301880 RepID=A0ABQ5ISQ5_9ASTR
MGPQRRLGIYVGFNSPSIIKYLEPLIGNIFTTRFADCQFDETMFPILGGEIKKLEKQYVTWNSSQISFLDTRSGQCELEVQNIIHLQRLANELPDAFTDTKRVTKSYIPALNTPSRIDIPETLNESNISINFVQNGTTWNRNETRIDEIFAYAIASEIINDEVSVPKSIGECRLRNDWQKWQDAIQAELESLKKRQVFGPVT